MIGAYLKPINAIGVPETASNPVRAAQLTAAGEVIVRNPDTIPRTNATATNIGPSLDRRGRINVAVFYLTDVSWI